PAVALQLPGSALEAQVEQLFLGLGQLGVQFLLGGHAQLRVQAVSHQPSPTSRLTILAFIGSLWIARRTASLATVSATPASSNITRPGITVMIHHSGQPSPPPIPAPARFLVRGPPPTRVD